MWEAHYYCAKEYFVGLWYDTFRFNLYGAWDKNRKMRDCSVKIHSQDIQLVAEYFSSYESIYFVWHSLAWPCLSWVNQYTENTKKIVFWDPAFDMKTTWEKCYNEEGKIKLQASGKHLEICSEMYDEFLTENFLNILSQQTFPKDNIYSIYADGDRHIELKSSVEKLWIHSEIIEWANHWFTQEWKFEELFEKTLEFIEK